MKNKVLDLIKMSKSMVVFTGAGISTNSGIPDFRGTGGLYEIVKDKYNLPYPEAIFDLSYFRKNPRPFYDLSKTLLSNEFRPTLCHTLLAKLEKRGHISLIITQNIDCLHRRAGSQNILECHGTYEHGHCIDCQKKYKLNDYKETLIKGEIPYCSCGGFIKPDIVFFGEALPLEFYTLYEKPPESDLLLILGTSLNVQPASTLAMAFSEKTPSVIINKEETDYDSQIDYVIHEDLDVFADYLNKKMDL